MKACFVLVIALCLALLLQPGATACDSKINFDELLDECESLGRDAGALVYKAACLELTNTCPVPEVLAKIAEKRINPDDLFAAVVNRTCRKLFVLGCKNEATGFALDDDLNCALLLAEGPDPPVKGCENATDAQRIFDESLDSLCEEEGDVSESFIELMEETEGEADKGDPCECAKDGVSDCVETGFKGCKRHLKRSGDNDKFCYVAGGPACREEPIEESIRFPGAYWRLC